MKVLISGGGTGGHIYPAIAIANKIKEENKDAQILFVGTKKGLESEIVPNSGYELKTITVEGFRRKLTFDNLKRILKLFKGLEESRRVLKEFKPDIVIGTGGYVCGPVVFNAAINGIPTVIHEQNAFPGITNKILSKFVKRVLISFEDARKFLKNDEKVVFTGNPVRKEIIHAQKFSSRKKLGVSEDKKMILCIGGSGGSKKEKNLFTLNGSMIIPRANNPLPIPMSPYTIVISIPAIKSIVNAVKNSVPAVDKCGCIKIRTNKIATKINTGATPFVRLFNPFFDIISFLASTILATISIETNLAISDGIIVSPPTPSHLLDPLKDIPIGVSTKINKIRVITVIIGASFFNFV